MKKEEIITKLTESGLVAVVRAQTSERAKEIVDACIAGGVGAIELTFTVPFAHRLIEELCSEYNDGRILIGAGTVLDPETARIAILSGAQFIVSPCLNLDTIKLCNRYGVPVLPGVMTLTEAVTAIEAGADIIKVFPGDLFGPKIIKDFRGPLPQLRIMPTGGVSVDNAGEWIKAGAAALGVGTALTGGSHDEIVSKAQAFLSEINMARGLKNAEN